MHRSWIRPAAHIAISPRLPQIRVNSEPPPPCLSRASVGARHAAHPRLPTRPRDSAHQPATAQRHTSKGPRLNAGRSARTWLCFYLPLLSLCRSILGYSGFAGLAVSLDVICVAALRTKVLASLTRQ
eukprot:6194354-Pleurochrysis_carterae.AAC.2